MGERIDIPEAAKPLLKSQKCPLCKKNYKEADVSALGVRHSPEDSKRYLFFEVTCPSCRNSQMIILTDYPITVTQLANLILEEIKVTPDSVASRPPSAITDQEVERFLKQLETGMTREEFLSLIGLSRSEIENPEAKPVKRKRKRKKNNEGE